MSTKSPHALDRVLSLALQPWAIEAEMLRTIAGILAYRLLEGAHARTPEQLAALLPARATTPPASIAGDMVAVIPIHGVIAPRMTLMTEISGGTTLEDASQSLRAALAAEEVGTIVLDVDSPGGSVLGCREFAREVLAARAKKPIVAVANYDMCSAAYWISSAATEVVASPSARVGSIGVMLIHDDLTKQLEQKGIARTIISAGDFKADGHPAQPLTPEAKGRIQALVNASYTHFVEDVARGRGTTAEAVKSGYGKGLPVFAEEAADCGLVDAVATLEDTLARFGASLPATRPETPSDAGHAAGAPPGATGQDRDAERALERALLELELL